MFDSAVVNDGLGQARAVENKQAARNYQPSYQDPLQGIGESPDGLGAYVVDGDASALPGEEVSNEPGIPYSQVPYTQTQQMGGELDFFEPDDTSSGAAARSAGLTLLFVAITTGVGYAVRGGLGASSGLLMSAGLANGYRAQKWWGSADPSERHEAVVSGVFCVGEILGGLFVGYQAYKAPPKNSRD